MAKPLPALGDPITKVCETCGTSFEVPPFYSHRRYCSNGCIRSSKGAIPKVCPCGKEIPKRDPVTKRAISRKYCDDVCRAKYKKTIQPNPDNYQTFDCETCGEEITRFRKKNPYRFCSNACAAKWTRKVRHIGVKDSDVVLDSGWEALFWGVCSFLKASVERFDRSDALEWRPDHFYGPDFVVLVDGTPLAVEIKAQEDGEDAARWDAWRQVRGVLVVIGKP